jgi:hypothetical protein
MRVFLSWSGELSQRVAVTLRDWLPSVIQSIEPYVSSEDIDKGARWNSEISKELEESAFGVLCITPTNIDAPWLNFEAGALSKSIETSRVVPFLFQLERSQLPQGPLVQFQSVLATKDDVRRLVLSLNTAYGEGALDEGRLNGIFDVWWPRLEAELTKLGERPAASRSDTSRSEHDVMGEVLELIRAQQQLLNNPEALLPPGYLQSVIALDWQPSPRDIVSPAAVDDLQRFWSALIAMVQDHGAPARVVDALDDVEGPLAYILRTLSQKSRVKIRSVDTLRREEDRSVSPRA